MSGKIKRKVIIDTDGGVDDLNAILLALSRDDVEVVAITTVCGNVNEHQTALNVLRGLKVAGNLQIPVFKGTGKALCGEMPKSVTHGSDGLGNAPPDSTAPGTEMIKSDHAVIELIRLVNHYPGEIELIALGPLTNIALALRMDPDFGKKLTKCCIMGGNYKGVGNRTPAAEWNFYCDPAAANVVLHELGSPLTLVCWELCLECPLDWELYDSIRSKPSAKNSFLKEIEKLWVETRKPSGLKYLTICDPIATAVAIDESLVKSTMEVYCKVETMGLDTKGALIVDRRNVYKQPCNVSIVTDVDWDRYFTMLRKASE